MLLNEAVSLCLSTETRSPFNILTCKILAFHTLDAISPQKAADENIPVICDSSIQESCPGSLPQPLTFTGRVLLFPSCHCQVFAVAAADRVCGAELWYASLSSSALNLQALRAAEMIRLCLYPLSESASLTMYMSSYHSYHFIYRYV